MTKGTVVLLGAVGLGAGAGAWYLLDPREGARRRRRLRDRAIVAGYVARRQGRQALAVARDAREALKGLLADRYHRRVNGQDGLAERVQAAVARLASRPGVRVTTRNGKVTLAGPILAAEAGELLARVGAMRGVREVVDRLEPVWPGSAHEAREDAHGVGDNGLARRSWSAGERVMASAGGTLGLLGLGLLTRGLIARRA